MDTVNYEIYKKICLFLNEEGVLTPVTVESGNLIVYRIICAVWHRDAELEDRLKAIDQFKAIKRGHFAPSSPSTPRDNPFVSPMSRSPRQYLRPLQHYLPTFHHHMLVVPKLIMLLKGCVPHISPTSRSCRVKAMKIVLPNYVDTSSCVAKARSQVPIV